jgi:hypothetical protein
MLTFGDEIMGIINYPYGGEMPFSTPKESKEFYPNHCPSYCWDNDVSHGKSPFGSDFHGFSHVAGRIWSLFPHFPQQ